MKDILSLKKGEITMSIQLSPVGGLGFTKLGTWSSAPTWSTFQTTLKTDKYSWWIFDVSSRPMYMMVNTGTKPQTALLVGQLVSKDDLDLLGSATNYESSIYFGYANKGDGLYFTPVALSKSSTNLVFISMNLLTVYGIEGV